MGKHAKIVWFGICILFVIIVFFFIHTHNVIVPNPEPVIPTSTSTINNFERTFTDNNFGFSLKLPADYSLGTPYTYQELGPGKDISGVKFTIPAAYAAGTNLSSGSYISIENIPNTTNCSASLFLDSGANISTVTDNGVIYSKGFLNGAGAGNRYDETIYALPGTDPCLAIRYFIHYAVIDNYPPGTVKEFNETALINQLDRIRETLVLKK